MSNFCLHIYIKVEWYNLRVENVHMSYVKRWLDMCVGRGVNSHGSPGPGERLGGVMR